jgi:hypothetical protein
MLFVPSESADITSFIEILKPSVGDCGPGDDNVGDGDRLKV